MSKRQKWDRLVNWLYLEATRYILGFIFLLVAGLALILASFVQSWGLRADAGFTAFWVLGGFGVLLSLSAFISTLIRVR